MLKFLLKLKIWQWIWSAASSGAWCSSFSFTFGWWNVEKVDAHIGLLHRGTEKLIEYKTYIQAHLILIGWTM